MTRRLVIRALLGAGRPVRLAMRGASMAPLLREPMVLEVEPLRRSPACGDVLVFERGDDYVAHRVVGRHRGRYRTKGDAVPLDELVEPEAVIGRVARVWSDPSDAARRVDGPLFHVRGRWIGRVYALRRALWILRNRRFSHAR